jgi:hypothetical protein
MDNTTWLVRVQADGRKPRDPLIGGASSLLCHLVTSRFAMAGRRTVHR